MNPGRPEIRWLGRARRIGEACRHHAGDRVGPAIERERAANGRGISAEVPLPEGMTHDDHAVAAGDFVDRREDRAQHGPRAQHVEEARRDTLTSHELGLAVRRPKDAVPHVVDGRHRLEDLLPVHPVQVVLCHHVRQGVRIGRLGAWHGPHWPWAGARPLWHFGACDCRVRAHAHRDDAVRVGKRQWPQCDGIDNRKNRGRRTCPERKHEQCADREAGCCP